jgi:hypothetical protein
MSNIPGHAHSQRPSSTRFGSEPSPSSLYQTVKCSDVGVQENNAREFASSTSMTRISVPETKVGGSLLLVGGLIFFIF